MADLPKAEEIAALASLLSPGIIILWIRGRFQNSAQLKITDQVISFALFSVAYNAAVYPLFHATSGLQLPHWLWQFLLSFVVPLIISVGIVFFDSSEKFYRFTNWAGLRPTHHEPTAWDYAYRNRAPSYMMVHLTDGSTVSGVWAEGSFASSTAGDRDLLVSQLWHVDTNGVWSEITPQRSMLICGGSIRMVEFISGGENE